GRRWVGVRGAGVLADHHPDLQAAAQHGLEHAVHLLVPAVLDQRLGLEPTVPGQLHHQLAALQGDGPPVAGEACRDLACRLDPLPRGRGTCPCPGCPPGPPPAPAPTPAAPGRGRPAPGPGPRPLPTPPPRPAARRAPWPLPAGGPRGAGAAARRGPRPAGVPWWSGP